MDLTAVKEGLSAAGYQVVQNPNGTLNFGFEGGNYYIDTDPSDPNYVRLGFPEFWIIGTTGQYLAALEVCSKVSESMKAVKVYVNNSRVHCTVEQFVGIEAFLKSYPHYLRAIQGAARRFAELMAAHPQ